MESESSREESADLAALAASVDCFTEGQLQLLANVEPSTVEYWRKKGTGPDYVRLGTRYLYPRETVRAFIAKRVHVRREAPPKGQL